MTSFLFIRLSEEQEFKYGIPSEFLKEEYNKTFDLDNFSDIQVVNSAIKFIEANDPKILFIAENQASIGKLMYLVNYIREKKKKEKVEFIGEHRMFNFLKME